MSTPMWDVPEHMLIPVDVDGNGPAEPPDAHHLACWCGDSLCDRAVGELVAEVRGLRAQLDSLTEAIGDPRELRWHRWHCEATGSGDDLRELLVRIADAVDALAAVGDPEEGRDEQ